MALPVGSAAVLIRPTFQNFSKDISKNLRRTMPSIGQQAGADFGNALGSGFDSASGGVVSKASSMSEKVVKLKQDQAKASRDVESAAEREEQAKAKVEIAEQKLTEAKEKAETPTSRLMSLEEDLRKKREALDRASDNSKSAQDRLKNSTEGLEGAQKDLDKATADATSEIEDANRPMKKLSDSMKDLGRDLVDVEGKWQDLAKKVAKPVAIGLGVGAAAIGTGAGVVLQQGWERVMASEDAQASLSVQHDQGAIDAIMKNVEDSLGTTIFKYSEGASAAAAYTGAGVDIGPELEQMLGLTADAATVSTDKDYGAMTQIMAGIMGADRVTMEEINQLADHGLFVMPQLAEAYGVSQAELRDMVSAGEVDAATFMDVMENQFGGAASKAAETTSGALSLAWSSVGQFGEQIVSTIVPYVRDMATGFTDFMYSLQPMGEAIGDFTGRVIEFVVGMFEVLATGNFSEKLQESFGVGPDHPLVAFLRNARDAVIDLGNFWQSHLWPILQTVGGWIMATLVPIFGAIIGALMENELTAKLVILGIVLAIAGLITVVTIAFGLIVAGWIAQAIAAGIGAAQFMIQVARVVGGWVLMATQAMIQAVRMAAAWVIAMGPIGWIIAAIVAVGLALWAFFTQTELGQAIWQRVWGAITAAAQWAWNVILLPLFGWIKQGWQLLMSGISWAWNNIAKPAFSALGTFFVWVWQNILQPAWGWVQIAFTALVAGLSWTWNNILKPVFQALGTFFQWVWNNILKPAFGFVRIAFGVLVAAMQWAWTYILQPVFRAIGAVFQYVWRFILQPAFQMLQHSFGVLVDVLKWTWEFILKPVFRALGDFFKWVWDVILKPAFNALKVGFEYLVDILKWTWNNVLKPVFRALGDFFKWVWNNLLKPTFDTLKDGWDVLSNKVKDVWQNNIKPIFQAFGDFIKDHVVPAFEAGVDFIQTAWERIKEVVKDPVKFVLETVINEGIIGSIRTVQEAFNVDDDKLLPLIDTSFMSGWSEGGHTGPGRKYDFAGLVHADEFVVKKASRRVFERNHPGYLDYINKTGRMPGYAEGGMVHPSGGRLTSKYGPRWGGFHAGVDYAVREGTAIRAALAGTVERAGWNVLAGRTGIGMLLGHGNGLQTYYGHLSQTLADVGQSVAQGARIALSGNTGNSSGPHLHFELHSGGSTVNPLKYLNGAELPEGGGGFSLNPIEMFKNAVSGIVDKITSSFPGGGAFIDTLSSGANYVIDQALEFFPNILGEAVDWVKDKASGTWNWVQGLWGGGDSSHSSAGSQAVRDAVRGVANGYGWGEGNQWDALSRLINKESSWNPNAANPTSSARGLFQKMTSLHGALESTPGGQAGWGLHYIRQTYGNPVKALDFHNRNNWYADGGHVIPLYDNGGWMTRGINIMESRTRKPEPVLTNGQWTDIHSLATRGMESGGDTYYFDVDGYGGSAYDMAQEVQRRRVRAKRR